jgi:hypothetical protein
VIEVSFSDRIRAWLKGESRRKAPSPSTAKASKAATKEIDTFITSRPGVEGFVEPKTAIYSTTLLLVAADGEYLRRPIGDRDQARKVCEQHGIPLYDAAKVGYPKRMRDYDRGVKRDTVSLEELPPWPGDDGTDDGTGDGPGDEPSGGGTPA